MASNAKNLSEYSGKNLVDISAYKFGIVVSEWNEEVTEALYAGALASLRQHGAEKEHIVRVFVPGSYELPLGAQWLAKSGQYDAVICIGCVIQGETRHFDFICDAVAQGIKDVNLNTSIPIVFGVLTTDTQQQALDRAGGKHGNKGEEAAITAIKMLGLRKSLAVNGSNGHRP